MLQWAAAFIVITTVSAILGFGGILGSAAGIAQAIFFVSLAVLAISLIGGTFGIRRSQGS